MNTTPYDAWVLGRLMANQDVDPAMLDDVSPHWRDRARSLAAMPIADRLNASNAMCDALPPRERDDLCRAIGAVDLLGAPPDPPEREAEPDAKPEPGVVMRRASDITALPVEWLWRDRLPLGTLSLFAGDPKLGKSFATTAIAAAVSRGAPLPMGDVPDGPATVVVMSAEDDPARTIVPRLKSAGARLENVHILESVRLPDGSEALPSLRVDIEAIEKAVASMGDCRLIIIDPITAYLGGTDDHKNAELRGVLSPLKSLAERHNVAALLVTHLNKGSGTNGKYRVTGSGAYVGACRANFLFARDRDDQSGRRVLMLDNGCNLAAEVPTLAYRIEDRGDGPAVEWDAEPVDITADEALRAESEDRRETDHSEARECDRWLREMLNAGPVGATEIQVCGRQAGFTIKQLKLAKKRIGAATKREGFGPESKCVWSLSCDTLDEGEAP